MGSAAKAELRQKRVPNMTLAGVIIARAAIDFIVFLIRKFVAMDSRLRGNDGTALKVVLAFNVVLQWVQCALNFEVDGFCLWVAAPVRPPSIDRRQSRYSPPLALGRW